VTINDIVLTIVARTLGLEPRYCATWWLEDNYLSAIGVTEPMLDPILSTIGQEIGIPNFASRVDRGQLQTLGDLVRAAEIAQLEQFAAPRDGGGGSMVSQYRYADERCDLQLCG